MTSQQLHVTVECALSGAIIYPACLDTQPWAGSPWKLMNLQMLLNGERQLQLLLVHADAWSSKHSKSRHG